MESVALAQEAPIVSPVRVLLVDDHPAVRELLRIVLMAAPSIAVVGEAEDGLEAIEHVENLRPDVVIMDITMPGMSGLEASRQIRTRFPQIEVVIVTAHNDLVYLHHAQDAGAIAFVLKETLATDLILAIDSCIDGERYTSPAIARSGVRMADVSDKSRQKTIPCQSA